MYLTAHVVPMATLVSMWYESHDLHSPVMKGFSFHSARK